MELTIDRRLSAQTSLDAGGGVAEVAADLFALGLSRVEQGEGVCNAFGCVRVRVGEANLVPFELQRVLKLAQIVDRSAACVAVGSRRPCRIDGNGERSDAPGRQGEMRQGQHGSGRGPDRAEKREPAKDPKSRDLARLATQVGPRPSFEAGNLLVDRLLGRESSYRPFGIALCQLVETRRRNGELRRARRGERPALTRRAAR
jgi:hypothetical protein